MDHSTEASHSAAPSQAGTSVMDEFYDALSELDTTDFVFETNTNDKEKLVTHAKFEDHPFNFDQFALDIDSEHGTRSHDRHQSADDAGTPVSTGKRSGRHRRVVSLDMGTLKNTGTSRLEEPQAAPLPSSDFEYVVPSTFANNQEVDSSTSKFKVSSVSDPPETPTRPSPRPHGSSREHSDHLNIIERHRLTQVASVGDLATPRSRSSDNGSSPLTQVANMPEKKLTTELFPYSPSNTPTKHDDEDDSHNLDGNKNKHQSQESPTEPKFVPMFSEQLNPLKQNPMWGANGQPLWSEPPRDPEPSASASSQTTRRPAELDDNPLRQNPMWGPGFSNNKGFQLPHPPTFSRNDPPSSFRDPSLGRPRSTSDPHISLPRSSSLKDRGSFNVTKPTPGNVDTLLENHSPHIAFVQQPQSKNRSKKHKSGSASTDNGQDDPDFPLNAEICNIGQLVKRSELDQDNDQMRIAANGHSLGALECKECQKSMRIVEVSGIGMAVCDMAECLSCNEHMRVVTDIDERTHQATCVACMRKIKPNRGSTIFDDGPLDLIICHKCLLLNRKRRHAIESGRRPYNLDKPLPSPPTQEPPKAITKEPISPNPATLNANAPLNKTWSSMLPASWRKSEEVKRHESNEAAKGSKNTSMPTKADHGTKTLRKIKAKSDGLRQIFKRDGKDEGDPATGEGSGYQSFRMDSNTAMMDVGGSRAWPSK